MRSLACSAGTLLCQECHLLCLSSSASCTRPPQYPTSPPGLRLCLHCTHQVCSHGDSDLAVTSCCRRSTGSCYHHAAHQGRLQTSPSPWAERSSPCSERGSHCDARASAGGAAAGDVSGRDKGLPEWETQQRGFARSPGITQQSTMAAGHGVVLTAERSRTKWVMETKC